MMALNILRELPSTISCLSPVLDLPVRDNWCQKWDVQTLNEKIKTRRQPW